MRPQLLLPTFFLLVTLTFAQGYQEKDVNELYKLANPADNNNDDQAPTCGYASCPKIHPNKTNVHIIAHTHDDVGWLKTVDQYFYGTRKRDHQFGVQFILDSLIPELIMDKQKRFIYVEMSFFTKWWAEQNEQIKVAVKRLVNEGRLEFVNGGWCMNDEASVTYQSTIEQMTLGLRFLNQTFGECGHPKAGWQIDPFGHTNEQASLFAQFGFDAMYFTRMVDDDKTQRTQNKSLDIIWHGDRALSGQSGSIFTNIFRDGYYPPAHFCFDVFCYDDYPVDNKNSYEYNIETKSADLVQFIRKYAESKLTKDILIPIGGDFHYTAAGQNFKALDKLIKYIGKNYPDINIFYSTPSCYQHSVHQAVKQKSIKLPEKYNDFMPYESSSSVWWSGYFSSRPSVKLIERELSKLLPVARMVSLAHLIRQQQQPQQQVVAKSWVESVEEHEAQCLLQLWEMLSDLQHHDAVTGTEKQHVNDDYVRRAHDASKLCSKFIGDIRRTKLNDYIKKSTRNEQLKESGKPYKLDSVYLETTMLCPLLNISQCDALESEVDVAIFSHSTSSNNSINNSSFNKLHDLNATSAPITSNTQHQHQSPVATTVAALPPTGATTPIVRVLSRSAATQTRSFKALPNELATKGVLLNVYNPLARPVSQHDIRLPCNWRCDIEKVKVIHLSTNETMKLIRLPVPRGVSALPFRDALTNYEILFYANIPALGYTSFVIEDSNDEDVIDEEEDPNDSLVVSDESVFAKAKSTLKSRRNRRSPIGRAALGGEENFEYFELNSGESPSRRAKRDSQSSGSVVGQQAGQQQNHADRVIVKFDTSTGMIVGLKRVRDGSVLNVTQKFGWYFPANKLAQPGAYIFRPNTSDPYLLERPSSYKMFKRKNGALIEIHQKWADWIWQTIRVDAKKNYIEFDYVVGPIPTLGNVGREVVTRYITSLANNGAFLTDSNGRQLLTRHKYRNNEPEQLGGSFFPVVSTILLRDIGNANRTRKSSVDAVAILVDRSQAGTSLHEGQMELLVHRRHLKDDHWGVEEALNEPGEDGRGLVTRGRHRLFLKFQEDLATSTSGSSGEESEPTTLTDGKPQLFELPATPRANLHYEKQYATNRLNKTNKSNHLAITTKTYVVHDRIYNELRQESVKFALRPVLTFDRLRVSAGEFVEMIAAEGPKIKTDFTMINATLPTNVHLLTLQPWNIRNNSILIRLENLDNPLTLHPFPDLESYHSLYEYYKSASDFYESGASDDNCVDRLRPSVEVDIEYLIKKIRIVALEELKLGADVRVSEETKRLNWTEEVNMADICQSNTKPTAIKLAPRQIRTFLVDFEYL